MTTNRKIDRSALVAGAMATLAVIGMGFAGAAQARDNVSWSVGVGVPGAVVNVGNGGQVYQQPVYMQPQPVYVQPAPVYYQQRPVYVQPAPVYYQPRPVYMQRAPVYVVPQPVYYGRSKHHGKRHGGYYQGVRNGYGPEYGPSYAPGYYQRDRKNSNWEGGRR